MIQIGSSSKPAEPIELNENQKTLDAFFDIVINHNHMKTLRISLARDVYGFLKEYECIREIDLCRYQLNIEVSGSDETPFYVFIKAAMLEDHELCARALSKCTCRPWQSKGPKKHRFGAALRRGSLLDLRTAPRDILDLIPMDSLWTLMRASRIAEDAERSSTSSDDESDSDSSSSSSSSSDHQPNGYSIGREYLRLMTLRGESSRIIIIKSFEADRIDNPPKKKTKIA